MHPVFTVLGLIKARVNNLTHYAPSIYGPWPDKGQSQQLSHYAPSIYGAWPDKGHSQQFISLCTQYLKALA